MLRLALAAALLVPLVGAGCATAETPSDPLPDAESDQLVSLWLQQEETVEGHTIRFEEVLEYSLCPPGVTCVSPGVARILVKVDGVPLELTVPGGLQREGDTDTGNAFGLAVTVVEVGPVPYDPDAVWAQLEVRAP